MRNVLLFSLALLVCGFCLAPTLSAGAVIVDAGWYGFCFAGTVGAPITEGCQNSATAGVVGDLVTFTAVAPVTLEITDAYMQGDMFDVNINSGAIVFTTSTVPSGSGTVQDPNLAFADPTYSHGSANLAAGVYSVNVTVNTAPFGEGGAYLQVVSSGSGTPEPGTLLMLGGGLVAVLLGRRRLS
jgi:hypothetical protein